MKNLFISILCIAISFSITYFALQKVFNNSNISEETVEIENTDASSIGLENITSSFNEWSAYHKENIDLNADFIGFNASGEEIEKRAFLEKLITGNYTVIKTDDTENSLELQSLDKSNEIGQKISNSIKSSSKKIYDSYLKENTPFPAFDVTDLNGNNYNNSNTKGSVLGVICWYTQCTSCVQDFDILNDFYDKHEGSEELTLLSLAFDNEEKIKKFLSKKEFRYPVVPNQKEFIISSIEANKYPIYLIIDKGGNIQKTFDNSFDWITALDNI